MDTELTQLMLQLQANLQRTIETSEARVLREIEEVKKRQDIANGRVGKHERAIAALKRRLDEGHTLIGSLSKAQKAKLAAAAAVVLPVLAEALHRAVPILLAWLLNVTGGGSVPPATPAPTTVTLPPAAPGRPVGQP